MSYKHREFDIPLQSFFIFGPRGTGKSTWLAHHFANAYTINLLLDKNYLFFKTDPDRLISIVKNEFPKYRTFIIDEIQKVPRLLDVIHYLIDTYAGIQFIMTGSSSRKLKREGVDLLAGRAVVRHFFPYLASEQGRMFDLEQSLKLGQLPIVRESLDPQDVLDAYLAVYLKEEVLQEGLVRQIESYSRFLEAISFSHGSVLNMSNIARECNVTVKTVSHYISILEDLLLGFQVPVFTKKAKRVLSVLPKFYYFDCGVFRSIRPKGLLDNIHASEIDGLALEGLVAQHLRHWVLATRPKHALFFWRTKAGSEVDFVVYGTDEFLAIEVKASKTIHPSDIRHLKTFQQDYPQSKALLIYCGSHIQEIDGISCIPASSFLKHIVPNTALNPISN